MSQGFTNQQTYAVLPPTVQKFTSGSGTYTLPSGVKYIVVEMVGGGGGGGGSGSGSGNGTSGGNTTFGTSLLTANGGGGGGGASGAGGTGGSATVNAPAVQILAVAGSIGSTFTANAVFTSGGFGGSSFLSGGGPGGAGAISASVGVSATVNTGSGGGGASGNASFGGSAGGGAGAYINAVITSPSATYSYAVASGGTAGTAGTSGAAGGAGAAGIIIVTEYYDLIGIPTNLTLPIPINQGGTGVTNSNWTANSLTFNTTSGIIGTTTNDSAAAGSVGQNINSTIAFASRVFVTSNVATNMTSISCTAGDWLISGSIGISASAGNNAAGWISTTSATIPDQSLNTIFTPTALAFSDITLTVAPRRFSFATTTTVYASGLIGFSSGAGAIYGYINALRVR